MIKNIQKNKTTCVNSSYIHHACFLRGYTCESELDESFDIVSSTDT